VKKLFNHIFSQNLFSRILSFLKIVQSSVFSSKLVHSFVSFSQKLFCRLYLFIKNDHQHVSFSRKSLICLPSFSETVQSSASVSQKSLNRLHLLCWNYLIFFGLFLRTIYLSLSFPHKLIDYVHLFLRIRLIACIVLQKMLNRLHLFHENNLITRI